jgi:hypothetical protein
MSSPSRDDFDDLPILAELRDLLESRFADTRRLGRDPRPLKRSRSRTLKHVPAIAAVLVAVAVAGGALTVVGLNRSSGTAGPIGSGSSPSEELTSIGRRAYKTPACHEHAPTRTIPAVSQGAPSEALRLALGVLRRPRAPTDRLPRYLREYGPRGVYVDYVRRARVRSGVSYYVVPVAVISQHPGLSTGCYAAIQAAFRAELPHMPARLRKPTKVLLDYLIARDRRLAAEGAGQGVCLLFAGPSSSGGTCGAGAEEIRQSGLISSYGWVSGVVPDGVATVTVTYRASSGQGSRAVSSNVIGNVFAVPVKPSQLSTFAQTPATIWRSADGTVVKKMVASRGESVEGSTFCASPQRSGCL